MSRVNPKNCPGISKFIRPVPEYFPCPFCGGDVEIWSDEEEGTCSSCNRKVPKLQKEASCLDWCEFADQCKELIKEKNRR